MNDILAPKGTISEMIGTLRHLRAEVSELNELFDARWSADMRAIECWRKLNPGNDLVLPDHVNLCLWLMEERTRLAAENEKLRDVLSGVLWMADEWFNHGGDETAFSDDHAETLEAARAFLSASQPAPSPKGPTSWPNPTPEMLNDPTFNAIWNVIKSWDINVPAEYSGYCGATGNHVLAIWGAILLPPQKEENSND